jgi:twitching motility protein PilT
MNIWPEIQMLLHQKQKIAEIVVAPNSPLVSRAAEGSVEVLGHNIYTKEDVFETCNSIYSSSGQTSARSQSGVCSLSVRGLGRLRVTHITQRGSLVLRVQRISDDVPLAAELFVDHESVKKLARQMVEAQGDVFYLVADSIVLASTCAYSILREINRSYGVVICVLEEKTTYLMRHDSSLVIQIETSTDSQSVSDALSSVIRMEPDICILNLVPSTEDMRHFARIVSSSKCTVIIDVYRGGSRQECVKYIYERYGLSEAHRSYIISCAKSGDKVSHNVM